MEAASKLRDFKFLPLPSKDALEAQAVSSRPDLMALRIGLDKADRDADLARAQVWDNFNVTAGFSHQGSSASNPNDPNSAQQAGAYSWDAGITVPLPFFNRNQGNIRKAAIERSQTDKQMESLLLSIRQEIAADYEQLRLNGGLIRDYEESQLANARKVRDSQQTLSRNRRQCASGLFRCGEIVIRELFLPYYDVVAEYRRGLSRLSAAIGKDFNP